MKSSIESVRIAGFPATRCPGDPSRPMLLLVHGAFVTHDCFDGFMRVFEARGYRAVAASRRGRLGVGPARAQGLRVEDYVDDTLAVIAALGEAPVVVGHSLGGLIAQRVAELGKSRRSVLLSPAPAAMLTAQPVALPAYAPMLPRILVGQPILPSCRTCETIALNCVPEGERRAKHDRLIPESGAVYREMMFGQIRVDAARVTTPTLVAGGLQDRIVSKRLLEFSAKRYKATLRTYADHGHFLLEEPGFARIASDITDWLDAAFSRTVATSSSSAVAS